MFFEQTCGQRLNESKFTSKEYSFLPKENLKIFLLLPMLNLFPVVGACMTNKAFIKSLFGRMVVYLLRTNFQLKTMKNSVIIIIFSNLLRVLKSSGESR